MLIFVTPGRLDDEALSDLLWEAGAQGLEERGGQVRAYFEGEVPLSVAGGWLRAEERDWQAEWKRGLTPVVAGHFTIVPSWLKGAVAPPQQALLIDPGMAFGTGHHATTRMAVEAISALDLRGKRVLDVGSGSGILALAALLRGAQDVLGLDIDPVTIPAAYENAALNGLTIDGERVLGPAGELRFMEGSLEDGAGDYDLLTANLYAELHDALAGGYFEALREGGLLVLTGILRERAEVVRRALAREGFEDVRWRESGEWLLITARAP